jgi:GT2 family glycosyltransferase
VLIPKSQNSIPPHRTTGAFTVSIVSHGQAELCSRLLDDLARHAALSIGQLILTQNVPGSAPDISGLPFPVDVIDNSRPRGFGENHNQAFRRATGQYFAVMNPDLRLESDPFPALAHHLADPVAGIVAPLVREAGGTIADFARPLVSPWEVLRRRVDASVDPAHLARPDWMAGMFLAFRACTYADLAGFDERYFLYCEDVDICARTRLRGLRLEMAREVSVTHLAQRESRRSLRYTWLHVTSLLRFWSSPVYRDYRALLRSEAADLAGAR